MDSFGESGGGDDGGGWVPVWLADDRMKESKDTTTVSNLFVCLFVDTCVLAWSSAYTMNWTDSIVDTTEERLLFFDVQKDLYINGHVYFLYVCLYASQCR